RKGAADPRTTPAESLSGGNTMKRSAAENLVDGFKLCSMSGLITGISEGTRADGSVWVRVAVDVTRFLPGYQVTGNVRHTYLTVWADDVTAEELKDLPRNRTMLQKLVPLKRMVTVDVADIRGGSYENKEGKRIHTIEVTPVHLTLNPPAENYTVTLDAGTEI
ncbi:hypothetical protein ACIRD3_37690, partial [Kitasatospora sp. NPDC093550]|uniref:hypothetical protein n=1 Tax=Kitasatospora sp. NPDC093550 TaxID=3364089 RepID=UPI0038174A54